MCSFSSSRQQHSCCKINKKYKRNLQVIPSLDFIIGLDRLADVGQIRSIHTGGCNIPWPRSLFFGSYVLERIGTMASDFSLSLCALDCVLYSNDQRSLEHRGDHSNIHGRGTFVYIPSNACGARICPVRGRDHEPAAEPGYAALAFI